MTLSSLLSSPTPCPCSLPTYTSSRSSRPTPCTPSSPPAPPPLLLPPTTLHLTAPPVTRRPTPSTLPLQQLWGFSTTTKPRSLNPPILATTLITRPGTPSPSRHTRGCPAPRCHGNITRCPHPETPTLQLDIQHQVHRIRYISPCLRGTTRVKARDTQCTLRVCLRTHRPHWDISLHLHMKRSR